MLIAADKALSRQARVLTGRSPGIAQVTAAGLLARDGLNSADI